MIMPPDGLHEWDLCKTEKLGAKKCGEVLSVCRPAEESTTRETSKSALESALRNRMLWGVLPRVLVLQRTTACVCVCQGKGHKLNILWPSTAHLWRFTTPTSLCGRLVCFPSTDCFLGDQNVHKLLLFLRKGESACLGIHALRRHVASKSPNNKTWWWWWMVVREKGGRVCSSVDTLFYVNSLEIWPTRSRKFWRGQQQFHWREPSLAQSLPALNVSHPPTPKNHGPALSLSLYQEATTDHIWPLWFFILGVPLAPFCSECAEIARFLQLRLQISAVAGK